MKLYATKEFVLNKSASRSVKVGLRIIDHVAVPMIYFFGDATTGIVFDVSAWDCLKNMQTQIMDFLDGDFTKFESAKMESDHYIIKIFGNCTSDDSRILGFRQTNIETKQSQCVITGRTTLDSLFSLLPVIDNYLVSLRESRDEIDHALQNYFKKNLPLPEDKIMTKGGVNLQYLFKELAFLSTE
jgi:hypothetical protein